MTINELESAILKIRSKYPDVGHKMVYAFFKEDISFEQGDYLMIESVDEDVREGMFLIVYSAKL